MNKIFLSSLITFILTSVSLQADSYSFVGAQTSFSSYENVDALSFGLKYGKQNQTWRTALSMNYAKSGNNKLTSFLLQADKGVLANLFEDSHYQPYAGFTVGMLEYKNKESSSGLGYGINGGVTYILNHKFDIDFGYRMMKTKIDEIDTIHNLTLSVHYFY